MTRISLIPLTGVLVACAIGCGGGSDSPSATAPTCPGTTVSCDGTCADLTSPEHCGACDKRCADGQLCSQGACVLACPANLSACSGKCVDVLVNPEHCGECLHTCDLGRVCAKGDCALTCPSELVECDGGCVDPLTDLQHCGASGDCFGAAKGQACPPGSTCVAGACTLSCADGQSVCDGRCTDLQSSAEHCGECGHACDTGHACVQGSCQLDCQMGLTPCGTTCVNLQSNSLHCGECEHACGEWQGCASGKCELGCPVGLIVCANQCVDPEVNTSHCGECGHTCAVGQLCSAGKCSGACPGGQVNCGEGCTSLNVDVNNCGQCGNTCSAPSHAEAACENGNCKWSCDPGWGDCDQNPADGCETDTGNDILNCGSCGNDCPYAPEATPACAVGVCGLECQMHYLNCDGDLANGCELYAEYDVHNCGGCGHECYSPVCQHSVCAKLVFVSSEVYGADLGGLDGADAKCQGLASAAGLEGTFKAWLSSSTTSAEERLNHPTVPYYDMDGTKLQSSWASYKKLWAKVTEKLGTPILTDHLCNSPQTPVVWTGTYSTGNHMNLESTCGDWTSTDGSGGVGKVGDTTYYWSSWCNTPCTGLAHLYCVEQ